MKVPVLVLGILAGCTTSSSTLVTPLGDVIARPAEKDEPLDELALALSLVPPTTVSGDGDLDWWRVGCEVRAIAPAWAAGYEVNGLHRVVYRTVAEAGGVKGWVRVIRVSQPPCACGSQWGEGVVVVDGRDGEKVSYLVPRVCE